MNDAERERWAHAALWREAILPDLREALARLERVDRGAPISMERTKIRNALKQVRAAIDTAERAVAKCRRYANEAR